MTPRKQDVENLAFLLIQEERKQVQMMRQEFEQEKIEFQNMKLTTQITLQQLEEIKKEKRKLEEMLSERVTCSRSECKRQLLSLDDGTNCLQCGYFICSTCIIELLVINGLNKFSIGYQCSNCAFFNCNKTVLFYGFKDSTSSSRSLRTRTIRDTMVFASGVSTHDEPHIDGKVLRTFNCKEIKHEENMLKQEEYKNTKTKDALSVEIIADDEDKENSGFRLVISDQK
jgi:hypothetical protein